MDFLVDCQAFYLDVPYLKTVTYLPIRNSPSWEDTMLFCAYAGVRRCQDLPIFHNVSNMIEEVRTDLLVVSQSETLLLIGSFIVTSLVRH